MAARNRAAWNNAAYEAWTARYGTPAVAAKRIAADPHRVLRRIAPELGSASGLTIANPLGSHGSVAVAHALTGADVTVFDISEANARYARELARAAAVDLDCVVGDFLDVPHAFDGRFDAVCMELGVTHYFREIDAFVAVLRRIVKPGGRMVLAEFHPLAKKAFRVREGKARLDGDYFSTEVQTAPTPYDVFLDQKVIPCAVRRWTLGETVTSFAQGGFRVAKLTEQPHHDYPNLPGEFTLVAVRD